MDIAGYLDQVRAAHESGHATEHSYRPALHALFKSIDPALTVINEAKQSEGGMPDFLFLRGEVPFGWAEAKDIDKDVIKLKGYSIEQRKRYEAAYPNLIYTNGVDFEFIREGEQVHFVSIADFLMGLQPNPDRFEELERQLRLFAEQKPISIRSAAKLAEMMAAKAAIIKDEIGIALADDPEFRSGLGGQFRSFKANLLPNLTPGEFADLYAETITYGMFAARFHDTDLNTFSRQEAMEDLPASNPFLKGLFEYIAGPQLPKRLEYIVDDLVQVMRASDPHSLFRDFGKFTARNDPFVHFYEDFLAAYNPKKRKSRGVWYTPEPVVDFIVRAVDDVLKTEFGLTDGLADTSKVTVDWDTGQDDPKTGKPDTDNPMVPDWPEAEFIVGNPPFIGGKDIRRELGGDYAEALWQANPRVPKSADFVMQWWDRAAHILTAPGSPLIRFGFVTTNSITQTFSRRVIESYLAKTPSPRRGEGGAPSGAEGEGARPIDAEPPHPDPLPAGERGLSLILAIPDHPWTKATKDAAAVRIAMTVAERGAHEGRLVEIVSEKGLETDAPVLDERANLARINADLSTGADVTSVVALKANAGLSVRGIELHADGYVIEPKTRNAWAQENPDFYAVYVKRYIASSDLIRGVRERYVCDFHDLSEQAVRQSAPNYYQHLLATARIGRQKNPVKSRRELWWRLALPHTEVRELLAETPKYIGTVVTSKHRWFTFIDSHLFPDQAIMVIGSGDAFHLGVLSSRIHTEWVLRAGGWLGMGNDNRYNKSKVFDPFPFPDATPEQRVAIAELAEELDATRKQALDEVPGLTMTELYNLRERWRSGAEMDLIEQARVQAARAPIVDRLHEQIDAAVAEAYDWPVDLPPSEIVARLVALNHERAAEEKAGTIRWLRPDYQIPRFAPDAGASGS